MRKMTAGGAKDASGNMYCGLPAPVKGSCECLSANSSPCIDDEPFRHLSLSYPLQCNDHR